MSLTETSPDCFAALFSLSFDLNKSPEDPKSVISLKGITITPFGQSPKTKVFIIHSLIKVKKSMWGFSNF
jgi:hypothetical protein